MLKGKKFDAFALNCLMAEDLPTCLAPRSKRGLCVGAFFHSKRYLSIVRCIYIILLFYSNR